jgi:quinoprotein relay system zinc metallohydrolase 2
MYWLMPLRTQVERQRVPAMPDRKSTTRRKLVFGGLCLCCTPALPRLAAAAGDPWRMEEVAEGLFIRRGLDEDATQANEDAIANIGFIIGRDGVLVADPGGSLIDGERLRAAIRQRTQLPIKYVVLSHVHPDHIFGAGAFAEDKPIFVGHARLKRELDLKGEYYQKALADLYGDSQTGPVIAPTLEVNDQADLDLGGRIITARAHKTAHTNCDLSLFDTKTGTLLPADLLFVKRIPSLDGSLSGWLETIASLKNISAQRAVPGHGPTSVQWPGGTGDLERYLNVLLEETRRSVATGIDIEDASNNLVASERDKWVLFDAYNSRNVTEAYKELEWQ